MNKPFWLYGKEKMDKHGFQYYGKEYHQENGYLVQDIICSNCFTNYAFLGGFSGHDQEYKQCPFCKSYNEIFNRYKEPWDD